MERGWEWGSSSQGGPGGSQTYRQMGKQRPVEGGGPSTECQGPAGCRLHPLKHCGVEKAAVIKPFAGFSLGTLLGEGRVRESTPQILPPDKCSGHPLYGMGVGGGEEKMAPAESNGLGNTGLKGKALGQQVLG